MEKLRVHRPMRLKELSNHQASSKPKELPPYGTLYERGPYLGPTHKPSGKKAK